MDSAELHTLSALTDLDQALGRFVDRSKGCLEAVQASVQHHMNEFADRLSEAKRQIRVCQVNLAEASDAERDEAERLLDEAMERYRLVTRWLARAEDACQAYRRVARPFEAIANEHIPRAQHKLRTKHDEAADYLVLQVEGTAQIIQRAVPMPTTPTAPAVDKMRKLDSIVEFPLPPEFRWVSLEHISRRDDLRSDEGFDKVGEHDVRRVFGTLQRKVLPFLESHPEANGLTFLDLDGYTEEGALKPRQKAYEVFFGQDAIVLDGPLADGTFSVTNGRHRIKVARDLGWPAVPVRVIGEG